MLTNYTIHPLAVGFNETDQGILTYQRFYGKRIILPIYTFAIMGGYKKILVDTGVEEFMAPDDLEERTGFPVRPFEEALETIYWKPEDIEIVIHTHLHNDHCENDSLCSNAEFYVQKAELDFCMNPHPIDHRYYPDVSGWGKSEGDRGRHRNCRGDKRDLYSRAYTRWAVGCHSNISRKSYHNWFVLQFRKFSLWWRYNSAWRIAERDSGL